jgi:hypothetical protein
MENFLEKKSTPHITKFITTLFLLVLLPLLLYGIYQSVQVFSRAFGKPANILVRTDILLNPVKTDFLHAFAQGGEEATDMITPIVSDIQPLKPHIIRIDHIYDHFNVVQKNGSTVSVDFSQLDQIVSSITQSGATPLLSLSYMPSAIAVDGNITSPPVDWNDWSFVVQKTIEHYSGMNNKNLKNVYYEVWNEPDLAQFGGWSTGGTKNYLTLYQYAVIGAEKATNVNQFFIGGPSTTGLYKNWILALMKSGSRVDFFSWHTYSDNPKKFFDDQKTIASLLAPYQQFAYIPKLITESGFTGSKDSRYNTMFAAAHMAAVFRQIATAPPHYLFSFQLKDGINQEDGWGIIGHESNGKLKKPRYYIYSFLEQMAGTRLELEGEGSWVTALATKHEDSIRLLLVNYNNESSKSETVPVTFLNVTPGTYAYREQFLLGRNAQFNETISETSLKKEIFMPANSVAILELTKKESQ